MALPLLEEALSQMERYKQSGDGLNITVRCPMCGDSDKEDHGHLSIKIGVNPGEPIWYQCFRASCQAKGALTTTVLQQQFGITDMDVLHEVAQHNSTVSKNFDKPFVVRNPRDYVLVNLPVENSAEKLKYINNRLGVDFGAEDLAHYKIQLSLLEMLRINDIRRLAVRKDWANKLDVCCIGFISMFSDYMICRDITPDNETGMRYYTYRLSGRPDPNDLRIYSIPREIDLLEPKSAIINVAEGPFSLLGAYLNTDIGTEHPNSAWVANCGSQYLNTILRVCKQYGLLKVRINIWSDSEIKLAMYKKVYEALKTRLDIRRFTVYYNSKAEDFGHKAEDIKISAATIYRKNGAD